MGLLSFIPFIGKILDKGLDVVDKFVEDKDKANELKTAIKNQILIQNHEEIIKELDTITERWKSDNEHLITRTIRPLAYSFVLLNFAVMTLLDGNVGKFHINVAYLPIYQSLLLTMTIAYFGSRGIEKVVKRIKP